MAGSASQRAALMGLSRSALRQIAKGERLRGMDQDESDRVGREARAATEILEAMDEERLERIAATQLGALVRSEFASMDHDGMAETALSLARALADKLDGRS